MDLVFSLNTCQIGEVTIDFLCVCVLKYMHSLVLPLEQNEEQQFSSSKLLASLFHFPLGLIGEING